MKYYMKYSTAIYNIYLKWFSAEDIYVYSIDEVFIDITYHLQTYHMTPRELITRVIKNVYDETGITASRWNWKQICIYAKLQWTLLQNILLQINME